MEGNELPLSVCDAIRTRRSVRSFRPDPVPTTILRSVLELARKSPSWSNTQPWELAVVTGRPLAALKDALSAKVQAGVAPNPDIPWPRFPDRYHQRSRANGMELFGTLEITRDDTARKFDYNLSMQRFFEAPAGIIFYLDQELGTWSILDLGILMQTIMLAAVGYGLGACPMAVAGRYPDVLREVLGIPATKRIFCGIALGYPNDAPVNQFRSERVPLSEFVLWCGDEG